MRKGKRIGNSSHHHNHRPFNKTLLPQLDVSSLTPHVNFINLKKSIETNIFNLNIHNTKDINRFRLTSTFLVYFSQRNTF